MIYERNIKFKLILLRLIFILSAFIIAVSVHHGQPSNLGYFFCVVMFSLSFIRVTNVIIYHDEILVCRFFFFGLLKFKWRANKRSADPLEFFNEEVDSGSVATETPADLLLVFFKRRGFIQCMTIKSQPGPSLKNITVALTMEEYGLILEIAKQSHIKVQQRPSFTYEENLPESNPADNETQY